LKYSDIAISRRKSFQVRIQIPDFTAPIPFPGRRNFQSWPRIPPAKTPGRRFSDAPSRGDRNKFIGESFSMRYSHTASSLGAFALLGVGGLLWGGGLLATLRGPAMSGPGRLVPKEAALTWRSPVTDGAGPRNHDQAQATFEVKNLGGTAVRIREVKSSCGCTTPKVEPLVIAPGATGVVEARATPLSTGEKTATISLVTDSAITPEVVLQLKIIGSRRPPYMGSAGGDLAFVGADMAHQVRKIYINTMEMAGSSSRPPRLSTNLSFLTLGPPKLVDDHPMEAQTGAIMRKYIVEATVGTGLPIGNFEGDVFVVDPWDERNRERIRVHGEVPSPLRAVPARLVLSVDGATGRMKSSGKLLILSTTHISELAINWDDKNQPPLIIGPPELNETGRMATVRLSSGTGRVEAGEYRLYVRGPSSPDRITIPVSIRREARP
jgi:hypothetical protein